MRPTPEERVARRAQQLQQRCRHFTGLFQATCQAGVAYWPEGPQPCLGAYDTGKHVCPHREFPTPAEAQILATAQQAARAEAVQQMQARMTAKQCLHCGHPYDTLRQVGHCVYASPCGHRQYHGQLAQQRRDT